MRELGRTDDRAEEFGDDGVGQGGHLVVGAVLDGVGNKHAGRIEAQGSRLSRSRVAERIGSHKDSRDATSFKVADVVHTARRTATSIG